MTELLRLLPGWEAIKVTRGHYRSCGKDPLSCCVGDLIGEEPLIRSGREANYEAGKDTGRFWETGAANVHWVIATGDQVERGIAEAIGRVKSEAVLIEGNSFLDFITADFVVMCARADGGTLKPSARRAISKSDVLYVSSVDLEGHTARREFLDWQQRLSIDLDLTYLPLFTKEDIPRLASMIRAKKNGVETNQASLHQPTNSDLLQR